MEHRSNVVNFGAGPSALPDSVLEEATKGLINYKNTGIGVTEISHRSKEFGELLAQLERDIREQLQVPPTHHILFTQGGGSTQFSSVVLNMLARHRLLYPNLRDDERITDYVITGSWSKKAVDEAQRLGGAKVNVVADVRKSAPDGKSFQRVPARNEYKFSPNPVLVYYCENETVDGVQFAQDGSEADDNAFPFDLLPGGAVPPLVADYSSSFMSRRIPRLADHAVIFAGAQKNIGPSGLTIVIVRDDCLVDVDAAAKLGSIPVPLMLSYKVLKDTNSVYNTPATFSIYVAGLVLERMRENGGLEAVEAINRRKQKKVYDAVSSGEAKGLFHLKVQDGSRSWMNVVFTGKSPEIEKEFLAAGESLGFKAMKGHRSVGGIRISLYNAITEEQVDRLVSFIHDFTEKHHKN